MSLALASRFVCLFFFPTTSTTWETRRLKKKINNYLIEELYLRYRYCCYYFSTFRDWIPVVFKCSSSRYFCYVIISDFLRHFLFLRGIRTGNCKSLPSLPLGFDYIDLARRYLMKFCRIRSQCSHVIVEGKWADFADGRCGFFPQRFWAILLMVTLGGMVGN